MAVYTIGAVLAGSEVDPCCCAPEDCCLYPATPEVAGDLSYPYADLPATLDITFLTVLYAGATKMDFGGGQWGYEHPSYSGGGVPLLSHTNGSGSWSFGDDGGGGSMGCLVGSIDVETFSEDVFPDILIVNGTDPIDRTSLCTWYGPVLFEGEPTGFFWTLDYGLTTPYKWHLSYPEGGINDDKSGDQDTPAGSYGTQIVAE